MNVKEHLTLAILYSAFIIQNPMDVISDTYPANMKTPPLPAPYEVGEEAFKNKDQVKAYLRELRAKESFLIDYEPLLISSSNIFEIPYSFQTCLLFRESRFDAKATSHVGALGVAQFTEETHYFVAKVIRLGKAYEDSLLEIKKKMEAEESERLRYIYFNRLAFVELYKKWAAYLKHNNLEPKLITRQNYKEVATTPKYAIGLSALYLKYLKERLQYKHRDSYSYMNEPLKPDLYLTLAGAYNQGLTRTWRLSSKKREIDLKYIISHQSRIRETRDYIKAIRTCMVAN